MDSLVEGKSSLVNAEFIPRLDESYGDLSEEEAAKVLGIDERGIAGFVHIPDRVQTENVLASGVGSWSNFEEQWAPYYDFHLLDTQIIVQPREGYRVEWVKITGTLNRCNSGRPNVRHVFPEVEFVDGNWRIEGDFGVTGKVGFNLASFLRAQADAGLRIEFRYGPRIAKISSGGSGHLMFWRFERTPTEWPTGGIRILAYLMRPRACQEMSAEFRVSAKCAGWLRGETLVSKQQTILEFTEGPETPT
ncbi:MAG: hypothetical protein ACTSP1_13155 [Candidatus Freyarchaeota archaeon]